MCGLKGKSGFIHTALSIGAEHRKKTVFWPKSKKFPTPSIDTMPPETLLLMLSMSIRF
jgi:hypothetical protein